MISSSLGYSRIDILGFRISRMTEEHILEAILCAVQSSTSLTIGCLNTYYYQVVSRDDVLKSIYDHLDILHSDGIGMYIASRILYGKSGISKRLNGTDLYFSILARGEHEAWKIFLLGNTIETLIKARKELLSSYPNICIVGSFHGYFDIDDDVPVKVINDSCADIVFIGLGIPKQELWLDKYASRINAPVKILCGSGIAQMAKLIQRGPIILRSFGLEWISRLLQEPRRLWKRYLIRNPLFVLRVLRQWLANCFLQN